MWKKLIYACVLSIALQSNVQGESVEADLRRLDAEKKAAQYEADFYKAQYQKEHDIRVDANLESHVIIAVGGSIAFIQIVGFILMLRKIGKRNAEKRIVLT